MPRRGHDRTAWDIYSSRPAAVTYAGEMLARLVVEDSRVAIANAVKYLPAMLLDQNRG